MQSVKGQQMMNSISPVFSKSEIEQSIYEAIGSEFDTAKSQIADVLLQLFPQTATWGLSNWEKRLGLATNLNEDIEIRRKKVIVKMQTRWPITPERMANIINAYTDAVVQIFENIAPYTFEIDLLSEHGFPDLSDIYEVVKKVKPSHLRANYKLISIVKTQIYYPFIMTSGEMVTVYPYTPPMLETKADIKIGASNIANSEIVTIYPKYPKGVE